MGKCLSKQKASQSQGQSTGAPQNHSIVRNGGTGSGGPNQDGNPSHEGRSRRTNYGNPVLVNENYASVRGEDVENELQLSELNVLGENHQSNTKGRKPGGALGRRSGKPMVTDGNGTSPLLSIGNEGENKQPLNTNISATRQEIFMIEDGANKSSKDKNTVSDGRQSSVGQEIFNSKPQQSVSKSVKNREALYRVSSKTGSGSNNALDQVFNSTPNANNRAIATHQRQHPFLTSISGKNLTSPGGFVGNPQFTLKGVRVDKMISEATNQINESSNVLRNNLEKESSTDSTLEKQLRTKYVLSWNELAIAYQQNKMYSESLEAFLTAIQVYSKLNLKIHLTFAVGDYFLSKTYLLFDKTPVTESQRVQAEQLSQQESELLQFQDFASEINVYQILTKAVYKKLSKEIDAENASFQESCDQIKAIFNESAKVDPSTRTQMVQMLDEMQTLLGQGVESALQRSKIESNLLRIRSFLIEFMVSVQEQALYESNKPSSHASSLSDELGSLIELVTTQLANTDLHKCLMNMGHMIRVWLQLPKQALCFYQQALQNGMNEMREMSLTFSEQGHRTQQFDNHRTPPRRNERQQNSLEERKGGEDFDALVSNVAAISASNVIINAKLADEELDLDKVDESLKMQVAQIFFFLGITYRSLNSHEEAILSYQNALHLNQYYSDCFYNLGNIFFEDKKDYDKAEVCYKSALESLDEERSNQMYRRIDEQPLTNQKPSAAANTLTHQSQLQISPMQSAEKQQAVSVTQGAAQQPAQSSAAIQNTVTYGRICYMIGETCKSKMDQDQAFKYYIKGIESEPTFNENFVDLSMLCRDMNEIEVSNVIIIFGKAIQQIKQMDKILEAAEQGVEQGISADELIFEVVVAEEERNQIIQNESQDEGNYDKLEEEEALPEIRLKEDLHSLLISAVCELKDRIQSNTIEFKLLRAIHILQRLNEKMINEIQSRAIMANNQSFTQGTPVTFDQALQSDNSPLKLRSGPTQLSVAQQQVSVEIEASNQQQKEDQISFQILNQLYKAIKIL